MNDQSGTIRVRPPQLPASIDDWQRIIKQGPTLNDIVEAIHKEVWKDDVKYRLLLEAVWDDDTIEGTQATDNIMAAQMLRDYARKQKGPDYLLSKKKLATISKALGVVLKRYGYDRKTRRLTVSGEIVPEGNHMRADE